MNLISDLSIAVNNIVATLRYTTGDRSMQHATLRNITTAEMPLTAHSLEGNGAIGLQPVRNDNTIPIIQKEISDQLPPTETAHGLSEPNNLAVTNITQVTKPTSVRMPHPSASGGDAIDCAIVPQKENYHEPNPALNTDSPVVVYESNNSKSTPTPPVNNSSISYHKDGHYFLKLLKGEQIRLLTMAEQAERDMYTLTKSGNTDISDEIFGILRSVSGKTKLLVSQKFKQFEGLCHSNLNPTADEKFPTTNEDLQGFWDMVNLQIEHIDSLFKELDLIKANNWQTTKDIATPFVPSGTKLTKRPVLKNGNSNSIAPIKSSPNALLMAQKREAQRKQLLELKRKHKSTAAEKATVSSPIEIFVNEN